MQPQASFDLLSDIQQILEFPFMQQALAAGTLVAILGGLVGYFVVLRGQTFAAHTLSQVGFPGAAGAVLVGVPPLLGLIAFSTGAAMAIAAGSPPAGSRRAESALIGIILAFVLALGFLFARLYTGFISALYSFLFGSFLGVTAFEVMVLLGVTAVVALFLIVAGRPLLFASVDADIAAARGVPVRLLSIAFLLMLGVVAAACALITGTTLVFALLVAPAAAARQLTARPAVGVALSVVIAVVITWLAMSIAYFTVYPIGFFLTTLALGAFLLARAAHMLQARRQPASSVPA
ncbi:MAG: metal ABC transporter permease [Candidatus Dormibacteria bacterium]